MNGDPGLFAFRDYLRRTGAIVETMRRISETERCSSKVSRSARTSPSCSPCSPLSPRLPFSALALFCIPQDISPPSSALADVSLFRCANEARSVAGCAAGGLYCGPPAVG